jgi:HPt (histidine-containing phosphotransfer) domain-containing protein
VEALKAGLAGKLLDAFLGHAPGRFASYQGGLRTGDWTAVEGAAHSLKSSSGHLGADQLLVLCDRLESAAESGDGETVRSLSGEFESVYARTIAAMEEERKRWPPAAS